MSQYFCPYCGKGMTTDFERYTHICAGSNQRKEKCSECGGTGRSTKSTWLGSTACPICHGTGSIIIRS